MPLLIALTFLSFALSLLLVPLCRVLSVRYNLVDEPDSRKIHTKPIPRTGGCAIALALAGAVMLGTRLGPNPQMLHVWSIIGLPGVMVFLIGLIDDIGGMNAWCKLAGQIVCSIIAAAAGIQVHSLAGHTVTGWLGIALSVVWLVACMNALNLIDGMDALAGGVTLFAGSTLIIAALLNGQTGLALAVAPMVGAVAGFLFFNFNPASIFLGDCGSLTLGYLLGSYCILWRGSSRAGMLAPVILLALPLVDACIAILRRFLRRQPIFSPDRSHIHHRLLDKGFAVRSIVLRLYLVTALAGATSLYIGFFAPGRGTLVIAMVVCGIVIGVSRLRYAEFGAAWRVLTGDVFRHTLNGHLAVQTLRAGLAAADTPEECWTVVERASKEFGFNRVEMRIAGRSFQYRHGTSAKRSWQIRVAISEADSLELSREFGRSVYGHSAGIADFAETIRKMLVYKTFVSVYQPDGGAVAPSVLNETEWPQTKRWTQHA